ncbi:sensor histidine kinase [Streptomyces collinus]|uniref:histidine kinase n=1 Tax=Streptomyces collinus (strain DSM 40733 / Tue 365) TaxID=1214242 RepID=S5UQV9_STRC3|nr:histidine kinase [Streptomyces collinus]AGS69423.1 two-component sensor kinase [Streptomyces collinus Tu 365]UJA08063.1 two-component sensor histidine kinase [Streptomyces collinus]UJA17072.1 two-component sensor histidine kinase [Streptomyces collinus]
MRTVQATVTAPRPRPTAAFLPATAVPPRQDAALAAGLAALASAIAVTIGSGRHPDALGWTLLLVLHVPLAWRRRAPLAALAIMIPLIAFYHQQDFNHSAPTAASMVVLYTVAVTSGPRRTAVIGCAVIGLMLLLKIRHGMAGLAVSFQISGWIISMLVLGGYIRVHRENAAAALERAERAERTREEEARRRVAEERLRVARDLHDLLAHSITLIGVRTSVAAHVLAADPERLDRAAVARALDDIAETCRTARGELRTTLDVLRDPDSPDSRGPLPGLPGLADLARAAAGAEVDLTVTAGEVPPAVGAAAYRIVQEALTNAVRHGGREDLTVRVRVDETGGALRVRVSDDGVGAGAGVRPADGAEAGSAGHADSTGETGDGTPGYGLLGMRERARSVGGTVTAGPRTDAPGFEVTAVLPLGGAA